MRAITRLQVDPTTPHLARMYDYYLGGKDNFAADRQAAEELRAEVPDVADATRTSRDFHRRSIQWLAETQGIDQFIDFGIGLITPDATPDELMSVHPAARIVYVDDDPVAVTHKRAMFGERDRVKVVHTDVRDPETVFGDPDLLSTIDMSRPIAILLNSILHFVADADDPQGIVDRCIQTAAVGSFLVLSHLTLDGDASSAVRTFQKHVQAVTVTEVQPRSDAQISRFVDGLQVIPPGPNTGPGLAFLEDWRTEGTRTAGADPRWERCVVARKP
ncbi:SAM-dependent methyltransferase [Actinoallomurus vinaceus]|uniref:SAM-dependent methyltransferase n=1 Tax=Actinoallomurus vinaceus TaxID=1080074 RepID=UPI0031F1356D